MSIVKFLGESKFYDMEVYKDKNRLKEKAIPFSGSLRPHINSNLISLLSDPLDKHSIIYEFLIEDILFAEELSGRVRSDGVAVEMARIWVKKNSMAMKIEPLLVKDGESNEEGD